jgi:hypothetical protein
MKVEKNEVYVTLGRFSDDSKCTVCGEKEDKFWVLASGSQLSNLEESCCLDCLDKTIKCAIETVIERGENFGCPYRDKIKIVYNKSVQKYLRNKKLERVLK